MASLTFSFVIFTIIAATSAMNINSTFNSPRDACYVTDYSQVDAAVASCTQITINGITVPGGKTLNLNLKDSAKVVFEGTITFTAASWSGYLIIVQGNAITLTGASGSVLDGRGASYWDGKGDSGSAKPTFMYVQVTGGSQLNNINLLNCPKQCVAINNCKGVTFSGWTIDNSAGDPGVAASGHEGHNTDGFDIAGSDSVVIKDATVKNQDDCICVNSGTNLQFSGLYCHGSHGLSLAVGISKTDYSLNTVQNVVFSDSEVVDSMCGIHVKTEADGGKGIISGVTYKNIKFSGVTGYGINVQQDYTASGGSTGNAVGNVPIQNLVLENVQGSVNGQYAYGVYLVCASGACSDWSWSGVSVTGSNRANDCNYTPNGFSC